MTADRTKRRSTYTPRRPLGALRVAELLGVSLSQPSRWRKGEERISADRQRDLLDLDYVMARLLHLFPKEQAENWMTSHNLRALAIFGEKRWAGVRWWSYHDPRWGSFGLWNPAKLRCSEVFRLTPDEPALREAAQVLARLWKEVP